MKYEELIETHINIVEVIAKTADDVIPIIVSNPHLDPTLKETISQVFRFIERIIKLLPDMLVSSRNQANHKMELLKTLDAICDAIELLPDSPEVLQDKWFEFNYWWKDFTSKINELVNSKRTIFLSMN